MAPKLYMMPSSPPVRAVLMAAKAINLNLEFVKINLLNKDQLAPEFVKINPQHTIPFLDDDGFYLADSHAIVTYLVSKYGKDDSLYPKDLKKRATVDHRLFLDTDVISPRCIDVILSIVFKNIKPIPQEKIDATLEAYGTVDTLLLKTPWVAGNTVTIADISIVASISTMHGMIPIDAKKFPKLTAWLKKIEALPFYSVNKEGLELVLSIVKSKLAG